MFWFYLIASGVLDAVIVYFGSLVTSAADIWKPVLIYIALFLGFILLHLAAFILYSLTVDKEKPVKNIRNPHRRFMVSSLRLYFNLVHTKIHVENKELIPNDKNFLYVCNHISIYDPMIAIMALADKYIGFVSKKENLEVPFAGNYMVKAGCVALDREDAREAVKAINAAADNITSGVCAMGIYPEGRVNKSAKGLLPFRNGAFKIAKKAKVPIVVSVISNTRKINEHLLRRKDVYLKILDVIPYEEIAGMKTNEIGERVQAIMLKALGEAT